MAYLLHLETSTEQCSVALSETQALLAHRVELGEGFSHAAKLHVFIDEVLEAAGIVPSQLAAISVSEGPGSFTGLRIGSVAAKGLCFALDIPLITLPTLAVLAFPFLGNAKIISLLDARRDEVYTASYTSEGVESTSVQAHILTADSFNEHVHETCCFVGTAAKKTEVILPANPNWTFVHAHPKATAMITLANTAFVNQKFTDHYAFVPTYIKPVRITPSKKDALGRMVD